MTPSNVWKGEEWRSIVESAEQDRRQLCDILKGKLLFSALYGTYTVILSNRKYPENKCQPKTESGRKYGKTPEGIK